MCMIVDLTTLYQLVALQERGLCHPGGVVSSPATPPKNRRGESLGALAKFLGCADVAFSIPELPMN